MKMNVTYLPSFTTEIEANKRFFIFNTLHQGPQTAHNNNGIYEFIVDPSWSIELTTATIT